MVAIKNTADIFIDSFLKNFALISVSFYCGIIISVTQNDVPFSW
jgi:hypothetical protein